MPGLAALFIDVQGLQRQLATALPVHFLETVERLTQKGEGLDLLDVVGLFLQDAQGFAGAGVAEDLSRGIEDFRRIGNDRLIEKAMRRGGGRLVLDRIGEHERCLCQQGMTGCGFRLQGRLGGFGHGLALNAEFMPICKQRFA